MDDKGEPSGEETPRAIKPTSKEFRKTWGFRRTTIAKREGAGDAELDSLEQPQQQQQSLSLRRSGRQPKRTERVEEFLTTVRRRGRRNAPVSLEECGEPTSCPVTDAETASEGSVDSTSDLKGGSKAGTTGEKDSPASTVKATGTEDEDNASDSDSDGLTLKELQNRLRRKREQEPDERPLKGMQNRLRKKRHEEDPTETVDVEAGNAEPCKPEPEADRGATTQAAKDDKDGVFERAVVQGVADEEPKGMGKHKPECEVYDPNALYCICRKPHNNRFMICCDRCEEWFHGDCVGISEARGRLLERNGEDYICPNCTILQVQDENNSDSAEQSGPRFRPAEADGPECTSIGTVEQTSSDDQGIKGRIEKAANPSGKKKLKIFQPVVEVPGASKCIGPGCSCIAQPDSVYCSNDCILKHAAATMKFLNSGKDTKPKPKEKTKAKSEKLILPRCSVQAGIKISSVHKRPILDKKDVQLKKVLVALPRSEVLVQESTCDTSTPSWASDHNYNAVKPERTVTPWPSVLCASTKEDRHVEEKLAVAPAAPKKVPSAAPASSKAPLPRKLPKKPPSLASTAPMKPSIQSPATFKGTIPKRPWASAPPTGSASTAKRAGLAPGTPTPASKKLLSSAPLGSGRKLVGASVPVTSPVQGRHGGSGPSPSQPNSQIRQNIRRSLKEILWKRVSDSDDLIMTENEVGKIALHIEKEMFNLFHVTDNRYKSKYRSIMFNLKDPKNQGLFHRVLREEISLAKLVRMKPEELVSKELSMWKERPTKPVMEARAKLHSEGKKAPARPEPAPDIEDSPPVSDSDEQESVRVLPESSTAPPLDSISCMLKDTTSQHRAHLFDLNCRVCTGQALSAEDEPAPKKQKVSTATKREEFKPPKCDGLPPESALSSAADELPTDTPEPDLGSGVREPPERRCFSTSTEDGSPEPCVPEAPACPAPGVGGVLTTVTLSGRDPRTAPSGSSTVAALATARPTEPRQDVPRPPVPSVTVPKSILAKPSPSPEPRYLVPVPPSPSIGTSETQSLPEGDTTLFLSRLSTIWKGFINMQSVAKFVTKAYPVSGCFDYLSEDLPDTIHIGGRIAPRTVWDYVGKLKSSVSKELCLIRFHPATEEEEVAYISLYSYFSSRGRFGVVANNSRHVKDLYLIPLSAKDPVPSKLLPFEGPGLESPRPNLILGLVICQKLKRPSSAGEPEKPEEKRVRLPPSEEPELPACPRPLPTPQPEKPPKYQLGSGDSVGSTTPPGSPPPPPPLPEPPAPPASASVLKILSSLKGGPSGPAAPATSSPAATAAPAAVTTTAPKTASPLEHILQTLFGKKKTFDPPAQEPAEAAPAPLHELPGPTDSGRPAAPLLDPIVQQFGQLSKEKALEEEEDDRPYDPEEEYGPERAFAAQLGERRPPDATGQLEDAEEREEVAYDPEDETILEEAKVTIDDLPNRMCAEGKAAPASASAPSAPSLVEQQKMLEELTKQIEEQKRQVEEQEEALRQQRAAVGVSMAHFSVSDALMSPPPKSGPPKSEGFTQEPPSASRPPGPPCEPRLNRDPRQARRLATEGSEGEMGPKPAAAAAKEAPEEAVVQPPPRAEEPVPVPTSWAPADTLLPAPQDVPACSHPESIALAPNDGMVRPPRKVLLPTPPSTAFVPHFPLQSDGQSVHTPAGREPFPGPMFPAQEPTSGSAPFEGPGGGQWANSERLPPEADRDREGINMYPPAPFQGPRPFGMSGPPGPSFPGPRGPVPPFAEDNISEGPRGPPPARFAGQKGPIPSLFSGQHGPPPSYGDARGPSPSFVGGPRGANPAQFEECQEPPGEKREFQDGPYGEMTAPPGQFEGPEQAQYLGARGPAPFQFGNQRRPLLTQFKGPRGGPPPAQFGGHFVGPRGPHPAPFEAARGPHPGPFEGPRGQAPGFLPGPRPLQPPPPPFEEQRVGSPPRFAPNPRPPAPMPFAGPRGAAPFPDKSEAPPPRFHFQGPAAPAGKPPPLLDLPRHPAPRKERWDQAEPAHPEADAPWDAPDFRDAKAHEYRGAGFEARPRERFEPGPKDPAADEPDAPPPPPDGRPGRAFEERRRERERGRRWSREREWEPRGRDWDKGRDRGDKGRDWDRGRERGDRDRDWDKGRERGRNRDRERRRDRGRSRSRDRDRDRDKGRDRDRDRGRERKERSRSRERARESKADAPRAAAAAAAAASDVAAQS
ncbi:LOW QUALITY PROTEIN: death-inducer obliterator 1 [Suncus etruscus]|uniref:LOW QUALITY PROTEIN: death-inducer obliterator 1 n=1 Tax=Suncus etruscus TaxID=109475 RepID=UPI00210FFFAE|nr:LOW QUALITY PROTEIN: death-inducer obliterator 1 [Suncus etruscus]